MQKLTKSLVPISGTIKNLEGDFEGLKYFSMEGLNTIGKPKNIYTETYADSDKVRVFVPDEITNESTKISLTLFFIGDKRMETFDAFNEYIRKGLTLYWDDVRKKRLYFYLNDVIETSEDNFKNGERYIKVKYSLCNIYGKTFNSNSL